METGKYGVSPFYEGFPISIDSMVHISGMNLKNFLKGDLELAFVRNVPGADVGRAILRTQHSMRNLFAISNVSHSCFVALAKNMDFSEVDEFHYVARASLSRFVSLIE